MKIKHNYRGFTLIELLIATTVFSVVLLLCTYGLLQIGRIYYKGITITRTQETARLVTDEISRAIQFGGGLITETSGSPRDRFCIGETEYHIIKGEQLKDPPTPTAPYVLVAENNGTCNGGLPEADRRELIAQEMRLARLDVTNVSGSLYDVTVKVVYGDADLLDDPNGPNAQCKSGQDGSQFCAVSELSTTVQKRVQ